MAMYSSLPVTHGFEKLPVLLKDILMKNLILFNQEIKF
jgi:hypothetical protein